MSVLTTPGDIALLLRLLEGEVPDVALLTGPSIVRVEYRGHRFPVYRLTVADRNGGHPVQRRGDGAEASVTVSEWSGPVSMRLHCDTTTARAAEHVRNMVDVAAALAALWEARRGRA